MAEITDILPFSLAEIILLSVPLLITALIVAVCRNDFGKERAIKLAVRIFAVISVFYFLYVFTLGASYKRVPIAEKLDISDTEVTDESLYNTLMILKEKAEAELDFIEFSDSGESISGMTVEQISAEVCIGYDRLNEKYPALSVGNLKTDAKAVLLSRGMTALDLTGIYSFFTGEANVNVHFPDYCTPFTVAHELAHQRGIARENEANFIAFLSCISSDNAYIRYSGYLNMYEYIASALNKTDKDSLSAVYAITDARIMGEMRAYREFYLENQNELLGAISSFINDKYLKAQGTEGIISYGLVVELCVAYYE